MEHRIFGDYVLTPLPNAFNDKTSWWLSKRGYTRAQYCFTSSSDEEAWYQIQSGLKEYIEILEKSMQTTEREGKSCADHDLAVEGCEPERLGPSAMEEKTEV